MINIFFKTIRFYFYKKNLPKFISFYNLNPNNRLKIKNIAIWLMCTEKENKICKKCKSCDGFKKKINYDYFELETNEIFMLEKFLKTKPIFSNIKIASLFLNEKNKNIINLLENNLRNAKTYFLIFFNTNYLKINDLTLNFNIKNRTYLISITTIKFIYHKILNKYFKFSLNKFININKLIIIDSLIFFFKIYLNYFFLKKNKILINIEIRKKLLRKNIFFLLNILEKYKKNLFENNNLNIFLLINFIIEYIHN